MASTLKSAAPSGAALGGSAGTRAQNKARKANAQHAGRPGRVCTLCGEAVHGGHKDKRDDVRCSGRSWRWSQRSASVNVPARRFRDELAETLAQARDAILAPGTLNAGVALGAIERLLDRVRRRR